MDIVYFGTDVFYSCFDYLSKHHQICALYTYHNDEDFFTEYRIVRRAKELGIPVFYEAVAPEQTKAYFESGVSLYFSAEYDRIIDIPEDLASFRGLNVHSSALPKGRGYYPIESAMERNERRAGVTIHEMKQRFDSGAILGQRTYDITPERDSIDLYLTSAANALEMTKKIFADLDAAWNNAVLPDRKESYWRRPDRSRLTLAHAMSVDEVLDTFRRYNGMTEAVIHGKRFFVRSVMCGSAPLPEEEMQIAEDLYLYAVRDGHVRLIVQAIDDER